MVPVIGTTSRPLGKRPVVTCFGLGFLPLTQGGHGFQLLHTLRQGPGQVSVEIQN